MLLVLVKVAAAEHCAVEVVLIVATPGALVPAAAITVAVTLVAIGSVYMLV